MAIRFSRIFERGKTTPCIKGNFAWSSASIRKNAEDREAVSGNQTGRRAEFQPRRCGFNIGHEPSLQQRCRSPRGTWSSGKVSLAALLFESFIRRARPKTHVVAILPNVLRTGSRYERWRKIVTENLEIRRVKPYGRFDRFADIDVFIVEGKVGKGHPIQIRRWSPIAPRIMGPLEIRST